MRVMEFYSLPKVQSIPQMLFLLMTAVLAEINYVFIEDSAVCVCV